MGVVFSVNMFYLFIIVGLHHPLKGTMDIMKNHNEDIHKLFRNNPPQIARKLLTEGFIDQSICTEVTNVLTTMTNASKADMLMNAVIDFLDTHSEPDKMMKILLDIFDKCGPIGRNVAKRIRN